MKKRLIPAAIVVVLLIAALLVWRHYRHEDDKDQLTLFGNVDIRQVSLAFDGSDRVAEMRVEEGDKVQAGQVLAVLDTRTDKLKLAQATAQAGALQQSLLALRNGSRPEEIQQSNAQVVAAQAELERNRLQVARLEATSTSTGGRAVSQQDLDNARAQLRVAQAQLDAQRQSQRLAKVGPRKEDIDRAIAQLQAAEADQALLQHQLNLAELKAPRAAIVRARLLEPGDMASPQRPAYTLALTDPKWVRAYVNEPALSRIRPGMGASVTTDSAPDRAIAGRIGFISSVAEFTPKPVQTEDLRTSLVYEVRVLVDDPQDQLRLGMPATVRIDLAQPASVSASAPSGSADNALAASAPAPGTPASPAAPTTQAR